MEAPTMRDATELPLRLIQANLELQLRIAALIQENGRQWSELAGRAVGDGRVEQDAELRDLLRTQDWQALAALPANAFWRQMQQRIGDGQELARVAVGAQNAFTDGLVDALRAWQDKTAEVLASSSNATTDEAWRALAEPWERLLSAFAPPAGSGKPRGGSRGG
ncbi:phasin family protein [Luteimonas sp. XNQY3]|nr:phasin family protein [Luteimonas sp. XNQY3]MCD9007107.1 phasin family protein [Luteimonas sp. XNQY3]